MPPPNSSASLSFYYHVYGLDVESDLALPELRSRTAPRNHHSPVKLFLRDATAHCPIEIGADRSTLIYSSAQDLTNPFRIDYFHAPRCYRFLYGNGIAFAFDQDGRNIWGIWPPRLSLKNAMVYLFGPVFAFVLHLRGFTCFHASAALIGGSAVAFVGLSGTGKSTIVGALARGGYPILGDDTAVLEEISEEFCIRPTYPHLRLWPDSASILFGANHALPKLVPPIRRIFLLEPRSPDVQVARIDEITPRDAFFRLAATTYINSYTDYGLTQRLRVREFHELGQLVARVVINRLTLGKSRDSLASLGPFLEQEMASRESRQPHLESSDKLLR